MKTTELVVTKLEGTGNDFVLIDGVRTPLNGLAHQWPAVARALCAKYAEDVDGLLVLEPSRRADVRMRIFNPDGSEASMCGNGIRCLAWHAHRSGAARSTMTIETRAGIKRAWMLSGNRVKIDMGVPRILHPAVKLGLSRVDEASWIDSGVPHLVCWVSDVRRIDVERLGGRLRGDRRFQPGGTNVDFVSGETWRIVHDTLRGVLHHRATLTMRTYERGVEGETQACGTGAVAAATAAVLNRANDVFADWDDLLQAGQESDALRGLVDVKVPGGTLLVEVSVKQVLKTRELVFSHAFLEGAVEQLGHRTVAWNGRAGA